MKAPAIYVISIFPDLIRAGLDYGILRRAREAGLVHTEALDLRDYTDDKHRSTDDAPYGGGPGMVMRCEPVFRAVEDIRARAGRLPLVSLSPGGLPLSHLIARDLSTWLVQGSVPGSAPGLKGFEPGMILLCGRYEGLDQRITDYLVDLELSIGDYILSGGELAALVVADAVVRLLPGALGNEASPEEESFATGLLDWPHYTRPDNFRGHRVPDVLLSGNHAKILGWREEQALLATLRRRPDLLSEAQRSRARELAQRAEPPEQN